MNKELEEIKSIVAIHFGALGFLNPSENEQILKDRDKVLNALQRLESIDNANPSEALNDLQVIENNIIYILSDCDINDAVCQCLEYVKSKMPTIKQALLKAQESEKENAYIEKIKTMMKQKDCVLRYIESEDCFAVKTILSDGWYKLTPEFVDDNVREEIKPLPLIEKNKQLKEENAEYKRVLDIIKETKNIKVSFYENGSGKHYKLEFDRTRNQTITQEEFNLLKRWLGNA